MAAFPSDGTEGGLTTSASAPLDVHRLPGPEDLLRDAGAWSDLLDRSAADTIFLTPEWTSAWIEAYGEGHRGAALRIERAGRLVGLAPLSVREERSGPAKGRRVLAFAADGSGDSDYLDLISERGEEPAVVDAVLDACTSEPRGWDLLRWNEIPADSPHVAPLRKRLVDDRWYVEEEEVPCAFTRLPGSWEDYLKALKPRMRTKVRGLVRELEQTPGAVFDRCESEDALDERLASLYELHRARWGLEGGSGVFESVGKRRFYEILSRSFLRRGWLRFYSLAVGGRFVAHQFCFERKGTMFLLQEGYDPEHGDRGVGNALRALVFRDAIARGTAVYDFLGGVTPHKLSWGAEVKTSLRITAAPPGLAAAAWFVPRRAARWGKDRAKGVLRGLGLRGERS